MYPNNTNSKAGKATPANAEKQLSENFFVECFVTPHPIDRQQVIIHPLPGSGIPMRDYFAAHALATATNTLLFDNSRSIAEWAYRVADAMLAARATVDESNNPPKELDNGSQFHGDYLKPHGNK